MGEAGPARWSASFGNDCGGCRRWWAGTVARPPSARRRRPSSECCASISFIAITSVPSVPTQNERDGLAGWGRRRTYHPVSRTAVNDAHPWKLYTPPGIHCHLFGDVMYVCHSIRRTDHDNAEQRERMAVDIKAQTPLIRFVCCGLVVGVLCLTKFCTKWRAQTIWVTRCSPVVQCMLRLQQ